MNIRNKQEQSVLDTLCSKFKLPKTNFGTFTYKEYLKARKTSKYGFIGYQVPRKGIDRIYRNDLVLFIPKVIDYRIECKSLDVVGSLSRAVITEEFLISDTMPEDKLIMFTEGIGFETKEFLKTFKLKKSSDTTLVNDMESLIELFTKFFN